MENGLDVDAAELFGDGALCIADVAPREWVAVLVLNVFANIVGSPCGLIRVTRSEASEHGERPAVS